jgi:hypothetical protein
MSRYVRPPLLPGQGLKPGYPPRRLRLYHAPYDSNAHPCSVDLPVLAAVEGSQLAADSDATTNRARRHVWNFGQPGPSVGSSRLLIRPQTGQELRQRQR